MLLSWIYAYPKEGLFASRGWHRVFIFFPLLGVKYLGFLNKKSLLLFKQRTIEVAVIWQERKPD
jgi:hypothetical protein